MLDSDGTVIQGNLIGTDASGVLALPNDGTGVSVAAHYIGQLGSSSTLIGTDGDGVNDALERNIISGNTQDGVNISHQASVNNVVAGNFIGSDVTGTQAVPNIMGFLFANYTPDFNRIGSDLDGVRDDVERNIISGNESGAIVVWVAGEGNRFNGNYIGTDYTGEDDLGNGGPGIALQTGSTAAASVSRIIHSPGLCAGVGPAFGWMIRRALRSTASAREL